MSPISPFVAAILLPFDEFSIMIGTDRYQLHFYNFPLHMDIFAFNNTDKLNRMSLDQYYDINLVYNRWYVSKSQCVHIC